MDKYILNFYCEDGQTKNMEFTKDTKLRDALIEYLKSKNSKIDLSPERITFLWGASILNNQINLDKSLEQIFKKRKTKQLQNQSDRYGKRSRWCWSSFFL